jgi:hypothetical protein
VIIGRLVSNRTVITVRYARHEPIDQPGGPVPMHVKPGAKLVSAVCETQVIVVRAPSSDVALCCGGAPLTAPDDAAAAGELDPVLADGTLIGKRYVDEDLGLELLCARGGSGTLTCNGVVLSIKGAKPLPSSD